MSLDLFSIVADLKAAKEAIPDLKVEGDPGKVKTIAKVSSVKKGITGTISVVEVEGVKVLFISNTKIDKHHNILSSTTEGVLLPGGAGEPKQAAKPLGNVKAADKNK